MQTAWRIVKEKHQDSAFDGVGAALYGGRWNHVGFDMVYCSGSLSLAALEILVHLELTNLHFNLVYFKVDIPDTIPITILTVPEIKRKLKQQAYKDIGSTWITENNTAVLQVPSVIIEEEVNFLINPQHDDFNKLEISDPVPFSFDERLIERLNK